MEKLAEGRLNNKQNPRILTNSPKYISFSVTSRQKSSTYLGKIEVT